MHAPKLLTAAAAAVLLFTACSSSKSSSGTSSGTNAPTTSTSIVAAPKGIPAATAAFYSFSEPIPTTPGALIKSARVAAPNIKGDVYRVLYVSTTVDNVPTPVTGLVIVPHTTAPAGGFPVVSWGHGTNGMADMCAPSLQPDAAVPLVNTLLDQGWEVTASDYQGEGTPGLLPYIAGDSAARNTIDIVRAAHNLPGAHAGDNYVVWGHSEGGQTAMYTLHIGPQYAPELHMKGVVAGAPPSQFNLIYTFLQTSPFKFYLLMAAGGLNTAYGDAKAPLDQVLTPKGMTFIPFLDQGCSDFVSQKLKDVTIASVTKGDPFKLPLWKKILEANDPQQFKVKSTVPLLMIQGANDEQIPPISTEILAKHLCGLHQDLERWIYPGQTHAGVIGPSAGDMVKWITDRFAGAANPDPYKPKGLAGIDVTTCA
ncbi:MAG TPA: lipase family protein [Acidimicrobiia bacterium]|nr:lipase family protein [Acidimicrobiia bacterium]